MRNLPLIALLFCLLPGLLPAQKEVPEPTDFLVNDFAGMLSRQEVVRLGQKLRAYAQETSTQIVVVTETTLEGENVFDYAHRLAVTWGIGGGENDNGVLLFVARDERQISIQTGYGVEGFLPDAIAFDIIQNTIIPAFREGNYYLGIDRAVDRIMELGSGAYTNDGATGKKKARGLTAGFWIILFIFALVFLVVVFGNRGDDDDGGYYRGGRYDDHHRRGPRDYRRGRSGGGWIFLPGGGFGGGGGGGGNDDGFGGFGGGGFGGFGGGDFGGGGAIGEW